MQADLCICLLLQVVTPGVIHHCRLQNAETAEGSSDYWEADFELGAYMD